MRFKFSRVNGKDYLQIWEGSEFKISCGNADKLYKKLVRLEELERQTKEIEEIRTKLSEVKPS